ncbi:MAG: hypothetical protein LH702_29955 [Phormidesmis sp. CAN_BIN44]|nr:hypothetical protein [Phormidesmis sp. CAN_BIN44]
MHFIRYLEGQISTLPPVTQSSTGFEPSYLASPDRSTSASHQGYRRFQVTLRKLLTRHYYPIQRYEDSPNTH